MTCIDFYGIIYEKEFRFQEIAIIDNKGEVENFFINNSDIVFDNREERIRFEWANRYYQRVPFTYGSARIENVINKIDKCDKVYVIGVNRKRILEEYIDNEIIPFEFNYYGGSNKDHIKCQYEIHNDQVDFRYCAYKRVLAFRQYYHKLINNQQ